MTTTVTRYELRSRAAWITLDSPAEPQRPVGVRWSPSWTRICGRRCDDPPCAHRAHRQRAGVLCRGRSEEPRRCGGAGQRAAESVRRDPAAHVGRPEAGHRRRQRACVRRRRRAGGGVRHRHRRRHAPCFSFSEVRIGVIPAMISVVVLPKLGIHHAMRLFLTGERFDAPRRRSATGSSTASCRPTSSRRRCRRRSTPSRSAGRMPSPRRRGWCAPWPRLSMDEGFAYAEEDRRALRIGGREGMFASAEAQADGRIEARFAGKRRYRSGR